MAVRPTLAELGVLQLAPTPMWEDNEACIAVAYSDRISDNIKHFDVRLHMCRDLIRDGRIAIYKIHTSNQLADILTKALACPTFRKLTSLILSRPR
jgi:hypothetical protein